MDETTPYSYDLVPYESHAFSASHPNNLATLAALFGMTPTEIDNCRVLELGCAGGGNIIPMACNLPESLFVGIDLSSRQIEIAKETAGALGLANIELHHRGIDELGPDFGIFDFIIVHGVYSWVDEEVRDNIMSVCKRNLAPDGVAYVSYNTYPGWHMPEALREMMQYHTASFKDPAKKSGQARALLNFLQRATAAETSAYGLFLKGELENLRKRPDHYIYHEFLEAENHPVYFHEFAGKAAKYGLRYLAEANVSRMSTRNFPDETALKLRLERDIIRREQYMDFLFNRRFRATLLCHEEQRLTRRIEPESVSDYFISSAARPQSEDVDPATLEKVTVIKPDGGDATFSWGPVLKAALPVLWDRWPMALPFERLLEEVKDRLGETAAGDEAASEKEDAASRRLTSSLLPMYLAGVVGLHRQTPKLVTEVSDRPKVAPLTRLQAREDRSVTNQWHQRVVLGAFERELVQLLDGEHDMGQIEVEMARLMKSGRLTGKDAMGASADNVREKLADVLEQFGSRALLIG